MTNVRRRIPLYRFGYIEYQPAAGTVSGSFEFQALAGAAHSPALEAMAERDIHMAPAGTSLAATHAHGQPHHGQEKPRR